MPGCLIGPSSGHNPGLGQAALGPPWPGCGGAGTRQLKTTYSILFFFFLNTCSFMKTITLARSKHIQTNLLYDTRGCQRKGEKPLLIHSAVPAQPRRGERPPRGPFRNGRPQPRQDSGCRSWERVWGYLAVIFIHISAFGGQNKRFHPNQQANLTQGGRAPGRSTRYLWPCRPDLHPGLVRVTSVGRSHPPPREPGAAV